MLEGYDSFCMSTHTSELFTYDFYVIFSISKISDANYLCSIIEW